MKPRSVNLKITNYQQDRQQISARQRAREQTKDAEELKSSGRRFSSPAILKGKKTGLSSHYR